MRATRTILAAVFLALAPGCYLAHERATECRDAPSASEPVVAPRDGEVALEIAGEPVQLDPEQTSGVGPLAPHIVLERGDLGVSLLDPFLMLDASGSPRAGATIGGGFAGVSGGDGRFALTQPSRGAFASGMLFVDRNAASTGPPAAYGPALTSDVAWLESEGVWIVASAVPAATPARFDVDVLDADGALIQSLADVGRGRGEIRIAATTTHAMLVWNLGARLQGRILAGSPLAPVGDAFEVIGHELTGTDLRPVIVPYGERFLVGAFDTEHVRTALVDPGCNPGLAPSSIVGDTAVYDRPMGIAVAPEHGFYVVCFDTGPGPSSGASRFGMPRNEDGVTLQVVGTNGERWGQPLPLVTGLTAIYGADCVWTGHEVLVVWISQQPDGSHAFSQRVRPTFL